MGTLRDKYDQALIDWEALRKKDPEAAATYPQDYHSVVAKVYADHRELVGPEQFDLDVIQDQLIGNLSPNEAVYIHNRVLLRLLQQVGLTPFEATK